MKKIIHLDFNYYFVQVEELANPKLRNLPTAVGGTMSRGIISTCNYIARSYGVRSGMSTAEARQKCNKLVLLQPHFKLYGQLSENIFNYLRQRFPILSQVSIDECFIDGTEYLENAVNEKDKLRDLQYDILKRFSIKCSIGMSFNKFLAKMASDMEKPLGVVILNKEDYKEKLDVLPIKDFYGIGKQTYPKLEKLNIKTIKDLVTTTDPNVLNLLGSGYQYCLDCYNGKSSDHIDMSSQLPKSRSSVETFSSDTNDYDEISSCLFRLSKTVSDDLIKDNLAAKTVTLTLRDSNFETHTRRTTFKKPIYKASDILNYALKIFDTYSENETMYRLVGVGASSLEPIKGKIEKETYQMNLIESKNEGSTMDDVNLFSDVTNIKSKSTDELIDLFNSKLQTATVFNGGKLNKKEVR